MNKLNYQTISDRIKYINSLSNNLPEDWISGNSQKPTQEVIRQSIRFLTEFRNFIMLANIPVPKILMGPIPDGGFGFSFYIDDDNKLFLRFLNEKIVELDIENKGNYECVELSFQENYAQKVIDAFLNLH